MNRYRLSLPYVSTLVLFISLLAAIPVRAATPPPPANTPFQFAGDDAVEFTWNDVSSGKAVIQIWNNGSNKRDLTVTISDMVYTNSAGKQVNEPHLIKLEASEVPLPAGENAAVTIIAQENAIPSEGVYSGLLHVSDTGSDTAIHRSFTISYSETDAPATAADAGDPAVPLVSTWNVHYYQHAPNWPILSRFWENRNTWLPLDIDVNRPGGIDLDEDKPLGYLTSPEEGMAAVKWIGPAEAQPYGKYAINLAFTGLDNVGDYTGKIYLMPGDEEKGTVDLTVRVTHPILWPVLAIALGIAAAYVVKWRLAVNRNILVLYKDEADNTTPNKPDEVDKTMGKLKWPSYRGYKIVDFERVREEIRQQIEKLKKKYRFSTATLGAENADYKSIVDQLKVLDDQAKHWNSFWKELDALDSARQKIVDLPGKQPEFTERIRVRLLRGVHLAFKYKTSSKSMGQTEDAQYLFDERRAEVLKATETAKSWMEWHKRHKTAKDALKEAMNPSSKSGKPPKPTKPPIQNVLPKVVQAANLELAKVETWLFEAATPEEFERADLEQSLRLAEGLVAGLKKYPVVVPDAATEKGVDAAAAQYQALSEAMTVRGLTPEEESARAELEPIFMGLADAIQPLLLYPIPSKLPAKAEERLSVIRRTLFRHDWLMLGLVVVLALYTATESLYFDKAFGTWWDYAKAFAWGAGTAAILEVFWSAINRLVGVLD